MTIRLPVHDCPTCRCAPGSTNPAAPGYQLVLEADRLLWADYDANARASGKRGAQARWAKRSATTEGTTP